MKKGNLLILIVYSIVGIAFIPIGARMGNSFILSIGIALSLTNIAQAFIYYRNTRPENIAAYQKKLQESENNRKDERKMQLRYRSGYITWIITMILGCISTFICAVLGLQSEIIIGLAIFSVTEYIVAFVIYRFLCIKM